MIACCQEYLTALAVRRTQFATSQQPQKERDFRQQLRRRQGFEFEIPAGGLRMTELAQPAKPVRRVDFRGGRAVLQEIAPGSDDARLLSDHRSPRKLLLEISARDGTKLSFPLYMTAPR